jgi:hypothetical protein
MKNVTMNRLVTGLTIIPALVLGVFLAVSSLTGSVAEASEERPPYCQSPTLITVYCGTAAPQPPSNLAPQSAPASNTLPQGKLDSMPRDGNETMMADTSLEIWTGIWSDPVMSQGGKLEFTLTSDGMINGNITNGPMVGLWSGFIRDDGVIFANYEYPPVSYQQPGFTAQAVGRIIQQQDNRVLGHMVFIFNNTVFSEGQFELTRWNVSPQQPNLLPPEYPFIGNGLYVYCAAPSVCGQRGVNALPGNWGWTSGLFNGLEKHYPHVWCNLFPGSC